MLPKNRLAPDGRRLRVTEHLRNKHCVGLLVPVRIIRPWARGHTISEDGYANPRFSDGDQRAEV